MSVVHFSASGYRPVCQGWALAQSPLNDAGLGPRVQPVYVRQKKTGLVVEFWGGERIALEDCDWDFFPFPLPERNMSALSDLLRARGYMGVEDARSGEDLVGCIQEAVAVLSEESTTEHGKNLGSSIGDLMLSVAMLASYCGINWREMMDRAIAECMKEVGCHG